MPCGCYPCRGVEQKSKVWALGVRFYKQVLRHLEGSSHSSTRGGSKPTSPSALASRITDLMLAPGLGGTPLTPAGLPLLPGSGMNGDGLLLTTDGSHALASAHLQQQQEQQQQSVLSIIQVGWQAGPAPAGPRATTTRRRKRLTTTAGCVGGGCGEQEQERRAARAKALAVIPKTLAQPTDPESAAQVTTRQHDETGGGVGGTRGAGRPAAAIRQAGQAGLTKGGGTVGGDGGGGR